MNNKFIQDSINFLNEEYKESNKVFYQTLKLSDKDQLQEGSTIVHAKYNYEKREFSFPAQFTKIRPEVSVSIYDDQNEKVSGGEVDSVDYANNKIKIFFNDEFIDPSKKYLIIHDSVIFPKAIINSLKSLVNSGSSSLLVDRLIQRKSNIKALPESNLKNIIKTANEMDDSFMILHGAPGAGKTYCGKNIISDLLKKGKKILITSNSHAAINNLVDAIEFTEFKGAKISPRSKYDSSHESVENIQVEGQEIDGQIDDYQLIAGTCFSLSKIKSLKFDYLIVDEASQIKMAYVLSVAKSAKNAIIMGDHLQLKSISSIDITEYGDAVLNYILQDHQILPKKYGYFLDITYRCEPRIAQVVSEVYYDGKLKWSQKKNKLGVNIVKVKHNLSSKINEIEAKAVVKLYRSFKRKKIKDEEILIIAPYNGMISYLRTLIKSKKVRIQSVDMAQGSEAQYVIYALTVACKSKEDGDFATDSSRVNVSISRGKDAVYLVMSENVPKSEHITPSFRKLLNIVDK